MLGKLMEETGEMEQGKGRDVGRKRTEKSRERVEERWGEREGGSGAERGVGEITRGDWETWRRRQESGKEIIGAHRDSQRLRETGFPCGLSLPYFFFPGLQRQEGGSSSGEKELGWVTRS